MIINISRAKTAMLCWRKAWWNYHENVQGYRTLALADGSAFHAGVAWGLAKGDWDTAHQVALEKFESETLELPLMPEERFVINENRLLVTAIVEAYRQHFQEEQFHVIQPECEIDVELPDTLHECQFLPPDRRSRDLVPHRLVGKTDAVVQWKGQIWLLEHKTTAMLGPQFWNQWPIDVQPSGYVYGIWKSTGLRPAGFILNAIRKPTSAQLNQWTKGKPLSATSAARYIEYEREPYLKSDEDLAAFEEEIIDIADEWEERLAISREPGRKHGMKAFRKSNTHGTCTLYNRKCDYYHKCLSHETTADDLVPRKPDYVDIKLEELTKGTPA